MASVTTHFGEYTRIVQRAMSEGWYDLLLAAHSTPMTVKQAERLLDRMGCFERVVFHRGLFRGKAHWRPRDSVFWLSLPDLPGAGPYALRVGLVIHEYAHVVDLRARRARTAFPHQKFNHGRPFCDTLHALLEAHFEVPYMFNPAPIYQAHDGPYTLIITTRQRRSEVSKQIVSPETAHVLALQTLEREDVAAVHVYSDKEGQYIGIIYEQAKSYSPSLGIDGARPDAPLLHAQPRRQRSSVRVEVPAGNAPVGRSEVPHLSSRSPRGVKLGLTSKSIATSGPGSVVRALLERQGPMTAAEIVAAVGAEVQAMGMQFPGSLVSRLKQGGYLGEAKA